MHLKSGSFQILGLILCCFWLAHCGPDPKSSGGPSPSPNPVPVKKEKPEKKEEPVRALEVKELPGGEQKIIHPEDEKPWFENPKGPFYREKEEPQIHLPKTLDKPPTVLDPIEKLPVPKIPREPIVIDSTPPAKPIIGKEQIAILPPFTKPIPPIERPQLPGSIFPPPIGKSPDVLLPPLSPEPIDIDSGPQPRGYLSLGPKPNYRKPAYPKWYKTKKRELRFFEFDCVDCPKSMGQILSLKADLVNDNVEARTKNCQGNLIGEDLFLTNHHCLPKNLLQEGVSCKNRVRFVFHEINEQYPGFVAECDQVVALASPPSHVMDKEIFYNDWAILRLASKHPERVGKIRTSGIKNGEKHFIFVGAEDYEKTDLDLVKISCEAMQKSLSYPQFFDDHSMMNVQLCDRPTYRGYSGSPVFVREKGEWLQVSIVAGKKEFLFDHPKYEGKNNGIVYSINLSCISSLLEGKGVPEACALEYPTYDYTKEKILREELLALKNKIDGELMVHSQFPTQYLQWLQMDENRWDQLPDMYKELFDGIKNYDDQPGREGNSIYTILKKESRYLFPQTVAPWVIQCVNSSQLEITPLQVKAQLQLPLIEVFMEKNPLNQLNSHFLD